MTSCGRILLPFVAKCVCTYAHTRRHYFGGMHGFQTSAFKKIHKHLAQGLGTLITSCTGKRRSAHQKNKPIVAQFVHICFSQCDKNVPDFRQIRVSCIQTFRMGGGGYLLIKSKLGYSE